MQTRCLRTWTVPGWDTDQGTEKGARTLAANRCRCSTVPPIASAVRRGMCERAVASTSAPPAWIALPVRMDALRTPMSACDERTSENDRDTHTMQIERGHLGCLRGCDGGEQRRQTAVRELAICPRLHAPHRSMTRPGSVRHAASFPYGSRNTVPERASEFRRDRRGSASASRRSASALMRCPTARRSGFRYSGGGHKPSEHGQAHPSTADSSSAAGLVIWARAHRPHPLPPDTPTLTINILFL